MVKYYCDFKDCGAEILPDRICAALPHVDKRGGELYGLSTLLHDRTVLLCADCVEALEHFLSEKVTKRVEVPDVLKEKHDPPPLPGMSPQWDRITWQPNPSNDMWTLGVSSSGSPAIPMTYETRREVSPIFSLGNSSPVGYTSDYTTAPISVDAQGRITTPTSNLSFYDQEPIRDTEIEE